MKNLLKMKLNAVLIATLIVLSSATAVAQRMPAPPQGERNARQEMRNEKAERGPRLPNLTKEQEAQLKELHISTEKLRLPIHSQLAEKEARLKSISTADEINLKDAGRVIQEIADLQAQLMTLKVENLVKMKEILTDEQELALNHQLLRAPQKPRDGKSEFGKGR